MYHIKGDKRSQTSARLIAQAFEDCLAEKDYRRITITDIQKRSTVSRSTFYRLFDSMDDVVAYLCDRSFEDVTSQIRELGYNGLAQLARLFTQCWMERRALLSLIVSIQREDILYDAYRKQIGIVRDRIRDDAIRERFSGYHISLLASIMAETLLMWHKSGAEQSPEEIVDMLDTVLSDFYHLLHE